MRRRSVARTACLVIIVPGVAMWLSTCSRASQSTSATTSQGTGNPWRAYEERASEVAQHGKVVYQVQYQPETVLFDMPSTERALKKISADGSTYTLDASVPAAAQLKPGSVLFLYGIAVRKVTAVQAQGSTVIVTTSEADVTDAIQNGHIEWEVPVTFKLPEPIKQGRLQRLEDVLISPVFARMSWPLKFEETSNQFEYAVQFGTEHGLDIDVQVDYKGPGAKFEAHATGYLQSTVAIGSLDIKDGAIDALKVLMSGLKGHTDFEWETGSVDRTAAVLLNREFKFTMSSMEKPLIIGGLPFVLEISAELLLHPAFTSQGASAKEHYTLDYSGSGGLSFGPASAGEEGEMHGEGVIGPESSVESPNAMGFVVALEVPRLELAFALLPPAHLMELSNTVKFQKLGALTYGPHFYKEEVDELLEEVMAFVQPVKPYAFVNLVLSTGVFTNGAMTSSLVAMPPCQRVQSTLSGNEGLGVKLNLKSRGQFSSITSMLNKITGPRAEFMPFPPFLKPTTVLDFKGGPKCPDDK